MAPIDIDSPAVHNYLGFLQAAITRMATNSAACKTWCITLLSAVVVIVADKGKPDYVWIAIFPLLLFCFLDAYYLGLEKDFRTLYDGFVARLHTSTATLPDMYLLNPYNTVHSTYKACRSLAIWPFYGVLLFLLIVMRYGIFAPIVRAMSCL